VPAKTLDSRRYQRIMVPEDAAIHVSARNGGATIEGVATVIGLGGIFLRCQDGKPPGTVLPLVLNCPTGLIECQGTVRHFNEQGMGIEFTCFTPENKQKLEALLQELQI
jgi:c-di-GMP-binding flagellar brake protein YcgR